MQDNVTEKPSRLDEPNERLKWARVQAGFKTATAAARRFNWNENTYRSHENGSRDISRKAAARYARAFKIHAGPGWFLYGEGAMPPPIDPEFALLSNNLTNSQRKTIKDVMRDMVRRAE